MALRRLKKENQEMQKLDIDSVGYMCGPISENDWFNWEGTLPGPKGTPYEGGVWIISITIPPEYPFKAPSAEFKTKIWHPSVTDKGEICLPLLLKWSPVYKISNIMLDIKDKLENIPEEDASNVDAATQFKEDKALFEKNVEDYKKQFAL